MRILLTICLLTFGMALSAKTLKWYGGAVVLQNDKVLTGDISLEPAHDLILFRTRESIMVYPAHKIKSFHFYDADANINRKFISLKDSNVIVRSHHLYEVVLAGEISVLRKQKKGQARPEANADHNDFDYYIRKGDAITYLTEFRKNVFPELLESRREQIIYYIHQNNLNPDYPDSAIKIIEFYNKQMALAAFAGNY